MPPGLRIVKLWRCPDSSTTAQEGVFTCNIPGDPASPISVAIYHPSESIHLDQACINLSPSVTSMTASIEVISGRRKTFKVKCRSTGGRVLNMSVTGPGDFSSQLNNIQAEGTQMWRGNDRYFATTAILTGGSDGQLYHCMASNGVSSSPTSTGRVELRGIIILYNITFMLPCL